MNEYSRLQSNAAHKDVPQRYVEPAANLIYAILLQAARDNDVDFLRHGDGREMYEWLKKQRQYAEPVSAFGDYECYQSMNVLR